jgi:hypothetical protein
MITPMFLPHSAIDALEGFNYEGLSLLIPGGADRLKEMCHRAVAEGGHVLLLVWPDGAWVMVAVEPPADVLVTDSMDLVPNLMANPGALQQMRCSSDAGQHFVWLCLSRPN